MFDQRRDAVTTFLLGAIAALASYRAVITLDPRFTDLNLGNDVWFEADLPRIVDEITHRWAPHSRATVHPVFSLFACAAVYAMRAAGMSIPHAVASLTAAGAAVWTMLMFQVLRAVTRSQAEALLFTAVGATSAGALFWLAVPETYVFGSITILAALWVAAVAECGPMTEAWFVAASAATLAVTVTNWVAGIAVTMTRWPLRRTLQISTNAFALVVVMWAAQRVVIPRGDFFIGYSNEQRYLLRPEAGGPRRILAVMLAHDIVMPPLASRAKTGRGRVISIQSAGLWAGGRVRKTALATWFALLTIGLYECVRSGRRSALVRSIWIVGAAQLALHLVYGTETFLYSANLAPILVIIAAAGSRTRARPVVLALATILLVAGGANNIRTWLDARAFFAYPATSASADRGRLAMPPPQRSAQ